MPFPPCQQFCLSHQDRYAISCFNNPYFFCNLLCLEDQPQLNLVCIVQGFSLLILCLFALQLIILQSTNCDAIPLSFKTNIFLKLICIMYNVFSVSVLSTVLLLLDILHILCYFTSVHVLFVVLLLLSAFCIPYSFTSILWTVLFPLVIFQHQRDFTSISVHSMALLALAIFHIPYDFTSVPVHCTSGEHHLYFG